MKRRNFLNAISFASIIGVIKPKSVLASHNYGNDKNKKPLDDRTYWYQLLYKIANPVVSNLAAGTLVKNMPLATSPTFDSRSPKVSYLEAVGRTYADIAAWVALPDDDTEEGKLRVEMRRNAIKGLDNCFTAGSPDQLTFDKDYQPIVDVAFFWRKLF